MFLTTDSQTTTQHTTTQPGINQQVKLGPFHLLLRLHLYSILPPLTNKCSNSNGCEEVVLSFCRTVALFARQRGVTHNLRVLPDGQTFSCCGPRLISQKWGKRVWGDAEGGGADSANSLIVSECLRLSQGSNKLSDCLNGGGGGGGL